MQDRANKEVEKLSANIISADPSSALSEDQKEKIFDLYMKKFKDINSLKKI